MTTPAIAVGTGSGGDQGFNRAGHTKPVVTINPILPNRAARRFRMDATAPTRSDGLGGWQEVTRPRRESLTEYIGPAVHKLDLPLFLDGFPYTSVQPDIDWLQALGRKDGEQSPVFKVTGPVYLSGVAFVLDGMDFGDYLRSPRGGHLVRQEVTLHCWKYVSTQAHVLSSPAKKHKHSHGGKDHPKTYTVKHGDTLQSIAAKVYGDPSRWNDIARKNGVRDPNHVKVGTVLKLP